MNISLGSLIDKFICDKAAMTSGMILRISRTHLFNFFSCHSTVTYPTTMQLVVLNVVLQNEFDQQRLTIARIANIYFVRRRNRGRQASNFQFFSASSLLQKFYSPCVQDIKKNEKSNSSLSRRIKFDVDNSNDSQSQDSRT